MTSGSQSSFGRFVERAEFKLILALSCVLSLASTFVHSWVKAGHITFVMLTIRSVHVPIPTFAIVYMIFMLLLGAIYFLPELLMFFFSPVALGVFPLFNLHANRY